MTLVGRITVANNATAEPTMALKNRSRAVDPAFISAIMAATTID